MARSLIVGFAPLVTLSGILLTTGGLFGQDTMCPPQGKAAAFALVEARMAAGEYEAARSALSEIRIGLESQSCESLAEHALVRLRQAQISMAEGDLVQSYLSALSADSIIDHLYASSEPVSLEMAESLSEVYSLLSRILINESFADGDHGEGLLVAALAAADRGRLQIFQQTSRRIRLDDPNTTYIYSPSRFVQIEGDWTNLNREGNGLLRPVVGDSADLLFYMLAADSLFIWHRSTTDGFYFYRMPLRAEELSSDVDQLHQAIRSGLNGNPQAANVADSLLRKLGDVLIPPSVLVTVKEGGELIIVPQGPLNLLPLDALLLPDDRPLLRLASVRIAPSLSLLASQHWYRQTRATNKILMGELPYTSDMRALVRRQHVERMLVVGNPVAASLRESATPILIDVPANRIPSLRRLERDSASEAGMRLDLEGADVIHFASHARAESGRRWQDSYVQLSPSVSTPDGRLTARHIMEAFPLLDTELVVLSACETAAGAASSEEGVLGLHYAFLVKGPHALIASLWSVEQSYTSELFSSFYRHWLIDEEERTSKAAALRAAKLELMAASPQVWRWGAFQVYGSY